MRIILKRAVIMPSLRSTQRSLASHKSPRGARLHTRQAAPTWEASCSHSARLTQNIRFRASWWKTHAGRSSRPSRFSSVKKNESRKWDERGKKLSNWPWSRLPSWFLRRGSMSRTRDATKSNSRMTVFTGSSSSKTLQINALIVESSPRNTIILWIRKASKSIRKTIKRLKNTSKRFRSKN